MRTKPRETADMAPDTIARGVVWTTVGLLVIRVFFFLTSLITARILTPDDFGIIGMAATVTMLIDTSSANGIDNFLICQQKTGTRPIHTAFTLNTLVAIFFTVLLVVIAPWCARLYHTPALGILLPLSGLAFLAAMLGRIPRALLIKDMQQSRLSLIDTGTNFLNFLSIIVLALSGFKFLSYVIALLISQALRTVLLFILARRQFQFQWDADTARQIFNYSKDYLPQTLLSYFLSQADYIVGGLLLGSTLLGYYYFGFEKAFLVVMMIRSLATQVFFPVFSRYQAEPMRLIEQYQDISAHFMFLMYPLLFTALLCSPEVMNLLYGGQWNPALFTFQCLLAYCFLSIPYELSLTLFNATGNPKENLKHFALMAPLAVPVFYAGARWGGLPGLTLAAVSLHSLSAFLMMRRINRHYAWPVGQQIRHILTYLAPVCLQASFLWIFKHWLLQQQIHALAVVGILSIASMGTYIPLARAFHPRLFARCMAGILQELQRMCFGKTSPPSPVLET